jgi:hypothetical protein
LPALGLRVSNRGRRDLNVDQVTRVMNVWRHATLDA